LTSCSSQHGYADLPPELISDEIESELVALVHGVQCETACGPGDIEDPI
jgi:hypothetical protein